MIFGVAELTQARKQQTNAKPVPTSRVVRVGSLQVVRRRYRRRDGEGIATGGWITEVVSDGKTEDGDPIPAVLTVLAVEEAYLPGLRSIQARACGFKTVSELVQAWTEEHPRSPELQIVYFAFGDHRDRDWFLQRRVWAGGDYTRNASQAIDPLPTVEPSILAHLGARARQRTVKRIADLASNMASQTEAQRLERIESVAEEMSLNMRRELTVISDRVRSMERDSPAACS